MGIAKAAAIRKGSDGDAGPSEKAGEAAGKAPARLPLDGAANSAHTHKKQYAAKSFLHKNSEHICRIHMSGDAHNNSNQMGSFNGNTVSRHLELQSL